MLLLLISAHVPHFKTEIGRSRDEEVTRIRPGTTRDPIEVTRADGFERFGAGTANVPDHQFLLGIKEGFDS